VARSGTGAGLGVFVRQLPGGRMTVTETELIGHLDFDLELPCETTTEDCSEVAEWRVVFSCCGKIVLFCDRHMQKKFTMIAKFTRFFHAACGASGMSNPFSLVEKI
jgi:hypothetical protein